MQTEYVQINHFDTNVSLTENGGIIRVNEMCYRIVTQDIQYKLQIITNVHFLWHIGMEMGI